MTAGCVASFREWFGLTPREARLLLTLYRARGALMTEYDLSLAAGVTENAVRQHVHCVRAAMQPEALDFVWGRGYRLTKIGRDECREAMTQMMRQLRRGAV